MIINFPTGLYDLPREPEDSRSITFMVSNEDPPRINLQFPKIPPGAIYRKKSVINREAMGELIFSVSKSSGVEIGSSSRQYEIGQILSFDDVAVKSVKPMLVTSKSEFRHNLNEFDYGSMGLDDDDYSIIENFSAAAREKLSSDLNKLKQLRADSEVIIHKNQKLINEINKNVNALTIIADNSDDNSDILLLIDKLKYKLSMASADLDQAISDADRYASEADIVSDKLRSVCTVVK